MEYVTKEQIYYKALEENRRLKEINEAHQKEYARIYRNGVKAEEIERIMEIISNIDVYDTEKKHYYQKKVHEAYNKLEELYKRISRQ